jgi:hypothetical protein
MTSIHLKAGVEPIPETSRITNVPQAMDKVYHNALAVTSLGMETFNKRAWALNWNAEDCSFEEIWQWPNVVKGEFILDVACCLDQKRTTTFRSLYAFQSSEKRKENLPWQADEGGRRTPLLVYLPSAATKSYITVRRWGWCYCRTQHPPLPRLLGT